MQKLFTLSVLLLSSFSLGLLYATVKMMMDSDPRAAAPLIVFLIAAPITVFLYFGGKLLGKQVNLGIIFGSNLQMFAICAACLTPATVPFSLAQNQTLWEWGIDALFIVGLAALATFGAALFIRKVVNKDVG